jgi:membrane protease YdiL (CAAX protease family)
VAFDGLTLDNWKQALVEGLGVCAILLAILFTLSGFGVIRSPGLGGGYDSVGGILPIVVLYAPHSFVQEVLTRGVLQSSLQRLLNDDGGIRSLMIASLIFGLFHSYIGLPAVAVTTLAGLLFGWLYMRHRNLIGATLVHIVGGTAAFAFHFM